MAIKGAPQKQVSKPITAKQRANIEEIKRGKVQEPIHFKNGNTANLQSWWTDPAVLVSRDAFDARVELELPRMSVSSFGKSPRVISAADSTGVVPLGMLCDG